MFDIPALGTYGTSPRGVLVGPDYKNVDLSIVKDTRVPWLGEAGSIQFRAEFFNLFNRAQFGLPSATLVSLPSGTSTNLPVGQQGVIQVAAPPAAGTLATGTYLNSNFGKIISTLPDTQREVQVSLKLVF